MSFALSVSLFFIIGVFYIVIVEFYTMLFRITGLTQEKARFQVISLLTNSGYSTTESELVVKVLPRRRIARTIMLFGYVFSITIVSVFVNAMMALPNSEKEEVWVPLIVVCSLFVIFMLVRRIPVVQTAFNALLEQIGRKWLHNDEGNPILLQEEFPKGVIAAATLNKMPADLRGKTLRQLGLPARYGLQIIYIRRNGAMMAAPDADTIFALHDEVVVYGPLKSIRSVFAYEPDSENDLKEAARPESASEFIHQQDVENASRAAHAERARETARTAAAGKAPEAAVVSGSHPAEPRETEPGHQPDAAEHRNGASPQGGGHAGPDRGGESSPGSAAAKAAPTTGTSEPHGRLSAGTQKPPAVSHGSSESG